MAVVGLCRGTAVTRLTTRLFNQSVPGDINEYIYIYS